MPYSKREAEIHYANLNLYSKDLRNSKPKEIEIRSSDCNKLNGCLSEDQVEYAALDFHTDDSNSTPDNYLNYASLHFHSENSNKLKSILPKDSEIILNPLNVPNSRNEQRGKDVKTDNLSVNNDNPQSQKKKSLKWLISAGAVAGICVIIWIAAVIVMNSKYDLSQKGISSKEHISLFTMITAYNSNLF